jgi:HK97 family phage major capsid protein
MAGVDVNRTTAGVNLPPAVSAEIWAKTQEQSAAMNLATRIPLPGSGVSVNTITGDPVAEWVDETEAKPVSRPTLGQKIMTPYKLAVIVPFSNEFRRDLPSLYQAIVSRLPGALAKRFDETVFTDNVAAPGSNFDKLTGAPAVDIGGDDTWGALAGALVAIAANGGQLNGWALSPVGAGVLLSATDTTGRPLYVADITAAAVPRLLGAPVYVSRGVADDTTPPQVGYAGDWSYAAYGTVEGVQVSTSDQATLVDGANNIHLWQQNMFAVRAEIEVGFRVRDVNTFSRLTYTAPVPEAEPPAARASRTSDK